jgi:hypothetical protein
MPPEKAKEIALTSSPHPELTLRSRVARFVQYVIGIPTALAGLAMLVLAAVIHHDHPVAGIALGEVGAVLLSLSILHLLYERLLRKVQPDHRIQAEVYQSSGVCAARRTAAKLGLSPSEDLTWRKLKRYAQRRNPWSFSGLFAWGEHLSQICIDLANRDCTVEMFLLSNETYSSQRQEDITGEKVGKSMIESAKVFFANAKSASPSPIVATCCSGEIVCPISSLSVRSQAHLRGIYLTGRNAGIRQSTIQFSDGSILPKEMENIRARSVVGKKGNSCALRTSSNG